jgi:hypothetical protein
MGVLELRLAARPCKTGLARRDRETVVLSRKPGLARHSRPDLLGTYIGCKVQNVPLSRNSPSSDDLRRYRTCETMRDSSLARSLVSQGRSREKSRSCKNPIETLRDPTLGCTLTLLRLCRAGVDFGKLSRAQAQVML